MSVTLLPVTLTFVWISAAVLLPLTAWIGLYRNQIGVLRGDGGEPGSIQTHQDPREFCGERSFHCVGRRGSTWGWIPSGFGPAFARSSSDGFSTTRALRHHVARIR